MAARFLKIFRNHWPLLIILAGGAILRWINLFASMSFFYDQARDALVVKGISSGHFVLVGPPADTSGLFMGPLWYYFLTPLYFVSGGHPALVLWLISLFDLATIFLVYQLGRTLFNQKAAIIAAVIWAFGALPVAYARTLSNPSTTAFWSTLLFWALIKISRGRVNYLPLVAIFLAILFQFNPATAYLLTPYVLFSLFILRNHLKPRKQILVSLLIFVLFLVPQVIFEIRNHFPSVVHLKVLVFSSQSGGFLRGLYLRWENWRDELSNYTFYRYLELSLVALLLGVAVFIKAKSTYKMLLTSWLVLPLLTYFFLYFRSEAHPHYLLGWIPVAVLLLAYFVSWLQRWLWPAAVGVMLILFFTAFPGLRQEIFLKQHIAQPADPNPIGLADQIHVVDFIYMRANSLPFGYHNYGIVPYWEDKEWQYLFSWYGQKKYGYLPSRRAGNPLFLIYEPDPYLPEFEKHWLKDFRSPDKGPVIETTHIASYTIEEFDKRLIVKPLIQ